MAQDTLHSAADIRKYFVIMTYVKDDGDIGIHYLCRSWYALVRLYPVADEDRGCEEEAFHHDSIVMPSPDRRN